MSLKRTPNGVALVDPKLKHKIWKLGLITTLPPAMIMNQVFLVLKKLNLEWKKTSPYTIRCVKKGDNTTASNTNLQSSLSSSSSSSLSAQSSSIPSSSLPTSPLSSSSANSLASSSMTSLTQPLSSSAPPATKKVKLGIQLFKIKEGRYLVDFKRLSGDTFPCQEMCFQILTELKKLVPEYISSNSQS
eukprot:TRINITY_DN2883_c0_g1_i1.p2 TRINITY_DN2883_c0_g1~~TRINITY_DN2883_c0_g1_i1.p2  ORF type:complete len:188 (-),score=69.79 TRINITY_DN2883_c0_g1_i1:147-710(-)